MKDKNLYKGRVVFRDVTFWPDDFRAIQKIAARLQKLYNEAQIVHTKDIDELNFINKQLEKLVKKYDSKFEAHSARI